MKTIEVPYLPIQDSSDMSCLARQLKHFPKLAINSNPWPKFLAAVKADCVIAYNDNAILLQYQISEPYLSASSDINGDIHKDSCVEFFLALDNHGSYYNMEFNCLGVCKIGYGSERDQRALIAESLIANIRSHTAIYSTVENGQKLFSWEMTLVIPNETFCFNVDVSFKNRKASGNFYKCGDSLPEPHYLCWNMIEAEHPDFHQKDFFGRLDFV
ncbi:carbohydrate-binding family 9-like protein [Pedobacter ginsenosidimutans]|nr:carbohydrate-binding family 9-like protein [Pedobacter ginsenosidimutans]